MAYLLATSGTKVQWYVVDISRHAGLSSVSKGDFDLVDVLGLEVGPGFADKDTAKRVAMAIALTTWRYVKMDGPKKVLTLAEKWTENLGPTDILRRCADLRDWPAKPHDRQHSHGFFSRHASNSATV